MGLKELFAGRYRLMRTDVYKLSHPDMVENADFGIAHFYNRKNTGMILYGLNERVIDLLSKPITKDEVKEAVEFGKSVKVEFPEDLFMGVVKEFGGFYPLRVEALPDGTWTPRGTPFAQIRNVAKGYERLIYWIETDLMRAFFPSGCATHAFHMSRYLYQNGLPVEHIHNFADRSYNSDEDAYWGGTAWGVGGLRGTDGFESVAHFPEAGFESIPAAEHSVVQNYKKELDFYRGAIDSFARTERKIGAYPIDTYNADRYVRVYHKDMMAYAEAKGVTIVCRPDSGKVFGQAESILRQATESGKKHVRAVIGENVTFRRIIEHDLTFRGKKIDPSLVTYGMGGNYHNWITRETHGWAMKACYSNGREVMKLANGKRSIAGEVDIVKTYSGRLKVVNPEEEILCHTASQYMWPYEYDLDTNKILLQPQRLPDTKARVDTYRAIPNLQQRIDISDDARIICKKVAEVYE